MTQIESSSLIADVHIARLKVWSDDRGFFIETFRKEWFPQRSWEIVQTNRSESRQGVVRGLHYHFRQVDYWYVPHGMIRAVMVDLRPHSPTFLATQTIDMGEHNPIGLFIPTGVAHGFAALTDVTMTYIVDNYYDSTDEFGVLWNDPAFHLDWGVTNPIVSGRDMANPGLPVVLEKMKQ
ncbi:MAG: dTDP-4-dehydrorhamnose 3,5-epimerase family protein [Chloroflexi bacterium]|nr:dTDP-4-dehydrorhamnose 3,5-epimerase family protein [Chloroflexota bacterium]MBP8054998.1 dTDP-4-dehydrorhamnose 3,5-epimerase family protein [Chloroflexota bacterium]